MSGNFMNYLTIFFNSRLFRFCFKDNFPELLGETRELRKVFFENINVKPIEDETWYTKMLSKILDKMQAGLATEELQHEIEEKLFDLYQLNSDERCLIRSYDVV